MEFRIADKFRLEIHWSRAIYEQDGIAKLDRCYLSGPVIQEVEDMNPKDTMYLDFGNQYKVFTPYYYIALFSWDGVNRVIDRINLNNVVLINRDVNCVPKFNNDDFILVDTTNHENEKHQMYLTYPSYLIKYDGERYDFWRS
jgi:hypothetical protein